MSSDMKIHKYRVDGQNILNKKNETLQEFNCYSLKLKKNFEISFNAVKNIFQQYKQRLSNRKRFTNTIKKLNDSSPIDNFFENKNTIRFAQTSRNEAFNKITIHSAQEQSKISRKSKKQRMQTLVPSHIIKMKKKQGQYLNLIMKKVKLQSSCLSTNKIAIFISNKMQKKKCFEPKHHTTQIKSASIQKIKKCIKYRNNKIDKSTIIDKQKFSSKESNLDKKSQSFEFKNCKNQFEQRKKVTQQSVIGKIIDGKLNPWQIGYAQNFDLCQY